jgi:hypothetical protein
MNILTISVFNFLNERTPMKISAETFVILVYVLRNRQGCGVDSFLNCNADVVNGCE